MKYLKFTTEAAAQAAQGKITENMGFPFGGTEQWAIVCKAYNQEIYYFKKPEEDYLDMVMDKYQQKIKCDPMTNVVGWEEVDFDETWVNKNNI